MKTANASAIRPGTLTRLVFAGSIRRFQIRTPPTKKDRCSSSCTTGCAAA